MVSMTRGHLLVLGRSCGLNIHTDRQTIQVTPNIRERTSNTPATINQAENNPNKNKLHYMRGRPPPPPLENSKFLNLQSKITQKCLGPPPPGKLWISVVVYIFYGTYCINFLVINSVFIKNSCIISY